MVQAVRGDTRYGDISALCNEIPCIETKSLFTTEFTRATLKEFLAREQFRAKA